MATLPPEVLFHIFEFLEGSDRGHFAATNKLCKQAVEDAAEDSLRQISENNRVRDDFMWRLRLTRVATARIERYYKQQDVLPTPGTRPTIGPGLLLRCAWEAPLTNHETQNLATAWIGGIDRNLGPATVLPDGKLVFFCDDGENCFFRFYNVESDTFDHGASADGSSIRSGDIGDHDLHCSNGFLVLRRDDDDHTANFSVWRLKDLAFVRDIRCGIPIHESVFDKDRGKIFFIVNRNGRALLDIMSIDIESGEQSRERSVRTQLSGTEVNGNEIQLSMGLSGRNIIIAAFDEWNDFPNAGLGVYTLHGDHPDAVPRYFACFEQGISLQFRGIRHNIRAPCQWPSIPFFYNSEDRLRAIRLSGDDPVVVGGLFPLGDRHEVIWVTETSLFVLDHAQGGELRVDEIDIESGREVRTICTGYGYAGGHVVAHVESTETVLFFMIERILTQENIIQTYLL